MMMMTEDEIFFPPHTHLLPFTNVPQKIKSRASLNLFKKTASTVVIQKKKKNHDDYDI